MWYERTPSSVVTSSNPNPDPAYWTKCLTYGYDIGPADALNDGQWAEQFYRTQVGVVFFTRDGYVPPSVPGYADPISLPGAIFISSDDVKANGNVDPLVATPGIMTGPKDPAVCAKICQAATDDQTFYNGVKKDCNQISIFEVAVNDKIIGFQCQLYSRAYGADHATSTGGYDGQGNKITVVNAFVYNRVPASSPGYTLQASSTSSSVSAPTNTSTTVSSSTATTTSTTSASTSTSTSTSSTSTSTSTAPAAPTGACSAVGTPGTYTDGPAISSCPGGATTVTAGGVTYQYCPCTDYRGWSREYFPSPSAQDCAAACAARGPNCPKAVYDRLARTCHIKDSRVQYGFLQHTAFDTITPMGAPEPSYRFDNTSVFFYPGYTRDDGADRVRAFIDSFDGYQSLDSRGAAAQLSVNTVPYSYMVPPQAGSGQYVSQRDWNGGSIKRVDNGPFSLTALDLAVLNYAYTGKNIVLTAYNGNVITGEAVITVSSSNGRSWFHLEGAQLNGFQGITRFTTNQALAFDNIDIVKAASASAVAMTASAAQCAYVGTPGTYTQAAGLPNGCPTPEITVTANGKTYSVCPCADYDGRSSEWFQSPSWQHCANACQSRGWWCARAVYDHVGSTCHIKQYGTPLFFRGSTAFDTITPR